MDVWLNLFAIFIQFTIFSHSKQLAKKRTYEKNITERHWCNESIGCYHRNISVLVSSDKSDKLQSEDEESSRQPDQSKYLKNTFFYPISVSQCNFWKENISQVRIVAFISVTLSSFN